MVQMRSKMKYLGDPGDRARGWRRAGKWFPRTHSGNGVRKPKKNLSGVSVKSENTTVLVVDGKTGKRRWVH